MLVGAVTPPWQQVAGACHGAGMLQRPQRFSRHAPCQHRRQHQTCRAQQQPGQPDCSSPSSCAADDDGKSDAQHAHAHAAGLCRRFSTATTPASRSVSRRQAMQRAAALAAAAAWLPVQQHLPAAAADSGALMVAPPTAQAPQGGARPSRGNPLRRIGLVAHSEGEWQRLLTPAQYATLRQAVTEAPRSSPLYTEGRQGTFRCAGCGAPLFSSITKFDAGTGWPSFYQALPSATMETNDFSAGMRRTEVRCSRCQGHLGHVFRDGPPPTNLRYCMNGVAMSFEPAGGVSSA